MIGLSTELYGYSLVLYPDADQDEQQNTARMRRTKLLDGRSHISNYGVSEGDRTFEITSKHDEDQKSILWAMFTDGGKIILSRFDGVYSGNISSMKLLNGIMTMTYLVGEKIS